MLARSILAPSILALRRFAPERLASRRSENRKSAPSRFVPVRLAFRRLLLLILAPISSTPLKSVRARLVLTKSDISNLLPLRLASEKSAPVTIAFFKRMLTNFTPRRSQRAQVWVSSRVSTLALIRSISCWETFSANSGET